MFSGETCRPIRSRVPSPVADGFENGLSPYMWHRVRGGGIGMGCGALLPYAYGKTLYFGGCGLREAVTVEFDTTKVR